MKDFYLLIKLRVQKILSLTKTNKKNTVLLYSSVHDAQDILDLRYPQPETEPALGLLRCLPVFFLPSRGGVFSRTPPQQKS